MYVETMERDFHEKISAKVRLSAEGVDRFRALTPFLFDDGDHLSIVLKKEGAGWVLSDRRLPGREHLEMKAVAIGFYTERTMP